MRGNYNYKLVKKFGNGRKFERFEGNYKYNRVKGINSGVLKWKNAPDFPGFFYGSRRGKGR